MVEYMRKPFSLLDTSNFTGAALERIEENRKKQALERDQVRSIFLQAQQKIAWGAVGDQEILSRPGFESTLVADSLNKSSTQ